MNPTRRDFLKTSLATGSLISWGLTVPSFLSRTAAAAAAGAAGAKETILVVIQLTGGNDGLNTVVPFKDEQYTKLRPTLRIPTDQVKKLNDEVGLHPSMTGVAVLLQDQALCVVQRVGYPNPNQSHFRSMDIWQAGSLADTLSEGWLGRALKGLPSVGAFHLSGNNDSAPLAVSGAPVRVPSLTSLADFQLRTTAASGVDRKEQRAIIENAAKSSMPLPTRSTE